MLKGITLVRFAALAALFACAPTALADEETDDEQTGEATDQLTAGASCRIACAGLYGTACASVSAACLSADSVLVGGLRIPCAQAVILACGAGSAGWQACTESCPP